MLNTRVYKTDDDIGIYNDTIIHTNIVTVWFGVTLSNITASDSDDKYRNYLLTYVHAKCSQFINSNKNTKSICPYGKQF